MIPVPKNYLRLALPTIKDEKYKYLLKDQLSFINKLENKN